MGKHDGILAKAINVLFGIIILFLWIAAGISTTVIGLDTREHPYLMNDSFAINMIILLLFVFVSVVFYGHASFLKKIRNQINHNDKAYIIYKMIFFVFVFIVSAFMVLLLRIRPDSDQNDIIMTAKSLLNKDYSVFEKGGYLNIDPHQTGIVLVLMVLEKVFGDNISIAFQLLNAVALAFLYKTFGDIMDDCGFSHFTGVIVTIFEAAFIPGYIYTTFVYGTIIGLCFAVLSTRYINLFYRESKPKYAIAAVVFTFVSLVFKSNYMIFLIGNIVFASIIFVKCWKQKKKAFYGLIIPFLVVVLISNKFIVDGVTYGLTGNHLDKGISNYAYIAMGIQENEDMYDGWWNFYNERTYIDAGYDTDKQNEVIFEYLTARLQEFRSNKAMALDFFTRKNASQWNNPDFQSIWLLTSKSRDGLYVPEWCINALLFLLNYLQFIILSGVVLYFFLCSKKPDILTAFAVIFIGGFAFHTFWEAKAQYTIVYFVTIIPMAVLGFRNFFAKIVLWKEKKFGKEQ